MTRFSNATAPDGSPWLLNSPSTLLHKQGNRPLTDGGTLGSTINYQLQGNDSVEIGSPIEDYAAMQQFGVQNRSSQTSGETSRLDHF